MACSADEIIGEIRLFAGNFAPDGWHFCDGSRLSKTEYEALYSLLQATWGEETNDTFALPDLRGLVPMGQGSGPGLTKRNFAERLGSGTANADLPLHNHIFHASTLTATYSSPEGHMLARIESTAQVKGLYLASNTANPIPMNFSMEAVSIEGSNAPHDNFMPSLPINYIIATDGDFPDFFDTKPGEQNLRGICVNESPFIGEIRCFAFERQDLEHWFPCDGRRLNRGQFKALHAIIAHGLGEKNADGKLTDFFNLPDLRGRVAIGNDNHETLANGGAFKARGSDKINLTADQLPSHRHTLKASRTSSASALEDEPPSRGKISRTNGQFDYTKKSPDEVVYLQESSIGATGDGLPHENRQPFLALHFHICFEGQWPYKSG